MFVLFKNIPNIAPLWAHIGATLVSPDCNVHLNLLLIGVPIECCNVFRLSLYLYFREVGVCVSTPKLLKTMYSCEMKPQ